MTRAGRGVAAGLMASLLLAVFPASGQDAPAKPIAVEAVPIKSFRIGSSQIRFGDLEFVGGFELRSRASEFGQLSALRFLKPGADFIGVADHGYWFFGTIERDGEERPVGVRDFRMQPIVDAGGIPLDAKSDKDAEGLEISNGIATVSFEGRARVTEYAPDGDGMGRPLRDLDFVVPRNELRFNQGFETLTRGRPEGDRKGPRIVIAERSLDQNGDIFAAIIEGPGKGVFKVRRTDDYDVTDGALLPNGDLLILERRFSLSLGPAIRLRRLDRESVRKGAIADGPVVMEAGITHRIDNMEALDLWPREDGKLVVSMLSDDNQNLLQRTIYLEFIMAE